MDLSLSEEHEALRRLAAEFTDREIAPYATAWDRAEQVDRTIVPKLGDLGFLGLTIPEEYGGSGGDHFGYVLVLEELGRGDSAVRGIVSVSLGLVGKSIAKWGSEEQKDHWLPRLCAGTTLACFALTEPDNGSDAANLRTKAVREGDEWVISGSKMFITNGTWADVALVFARTGEPGYKGISAFLVPTDLEGFQRKEIHGKLGLRGQATAELVFERVRVPREAMLGPEGKGFSVAMSALAKGRVSVAAGCVGIAEAALRAAVSHATTRIQFDGKVIAHRQLVQELISAIATDVDAARLLTWRAADLIDRGQDFARESSMAKLFASEAALRSANNALQVFGGYGYIDEYPVGKLMRDARVMTLYEGTSELQKLLIGRAHTGINAIGD
ncbi:MAG TPA: acyl-CoA dehydrogenase family protein [Actinospica sp.]|jgi:alkylation response protein AidB-like acyl-CoA dehydrogenase|nr:acyl-CoA dehydrogenase family protein [Actinospica sp.]